MARVLDFFVPYALGKLADIAVQAACRVLGVEEAIEKLREKLTAIRSYLKDAERKKHTDEAVNMWVKRLKDIMYDADDIFDDFKIGGKLLELQQHPSSSPMSFTLSWVSSRFSCVKYRHEIANRIGELNDRLKEIAEDNQMVPKSVESSNQGSQSSNVRSRATSSTQHDSDIVGTQIEDAANDIIKWILEDDPKQCQVYEIVGIGGIGKTTLARKIYNDERVKANFDKKIWLYISKNFDEIELFKELIRGIEGNVGEVESIQELDSIFVSTLRSRHKKIFLVLDDLWSANQWNNRLKTSIESSGVISKILITSRDANVGGAMTATDDHIHHVQNIDRKGGWELLRTIALNDVDERMMLIFEDVGNKILDKCNGLPLAIRVIAGILLHKRTQTQWKIVLESDLWHKIDDEIPGALFLSYEDLPSHLKTCFRSCVLFKGSIDAFCLVRFWMAEGFIDEQPKVLMEESGEGYYKELVSRNLLQSDPNSRGKSSSVMHVPNSEGESSFVMHDLLRALATNLTEGEMMLSEGETSKSNNPLTKIRRMSMSYQGDTLTLPSAIIEYKCLRVLLVQNSFMERIEDDTLKILKRLRVLDLSGTRIKSIPNCIGELLYLKCLCINKTHIRELPESIGDLMDLQTLMVQECGSLHWLPNSITRLCSLRCLCLKDTPLTHIPKGIGELTNINHLDGFMVGCDDSANGVGCDLEELQCLSNLRILKLHRLERAKASIKVGGTVLADGTSLRHLFMFWSEESARDNSSGAPSTSDEEKIIKRAERAENVCSQLIPPPSLKILGIDNFPGRQFPVWIMSTSSDTSFPDLACIKIINFPLCTVLPPLGQLSQLKYLEIKGALGIKKIGPEFLGGHGSSGLPAFPKLDCLEFDNMPNWEEWELCAEQKEKVGDQRNHLKLFPNLTKCHFISCEKLIAIPEVFFHATNLKDLKVSKCSILKEIFSLPPLKHLNIDGCPSLVHVEIAGLPQTLYTECRTDTVSLPRWLSNLLMKCNHQSQHSLKNFEMVCHLPLLKSCRQGEQYWHIIKQIPKVYVKTFDKSYSMRYIKDPPYYDITDPSESLQ